MSKFIYGLVDPNSNQIRYVGQTDDLTKRLQQHCQDNSTTAKTEWIKGLKLTGLQPKIIMLAEVGGNENAHEVEYRWIYFGRQNKWPLTNTTAMKSVEYYSLQGYFERLIVEMEKPEGLTERKHSWEDIKDRLIWLLTVGLEQIPSLLGWVRDAFPLAFNLLSTVWCWLYLLNVLPEEPANGLQFALAVVALLTGVPSFFISIFGERWVKITSGVFFIGLYFFAKTLL